MKIRELEKIVKDLGLECEWGNNLQVIMTIWQPHKNSGYNVGGKYYSAEVLPIEVVDMLNSSFEQLLPILEKNKIKIKDVSEIENGVISQWTLMVRYERLTNLENKTLDFEIETFEDWKGGDWVDYEYAMPEEIGYGAGAYEFDVSRMFRDFKLKPHEKEMVIGYIDDIFDRFNGEDNLDWIMNFVKEQNSVEPMKLAIEKEIFTPKEAIEYVFGNDEIYYENEKAYTMLFKLLTSYKVEDLEINKNSSYRGYLPDIIVESSLLFKNVLANWDFEYDSGQRVIAVLIQDEHTKQIMQWVKVKDPAQYYFDDWYDLGEYVLRHYDASFIKVLIDKKYLDFEHIDYDHILDFIESSTDIAQPETVALVVGEYMKEHQKLPLQEFMLDKLLTAFDTNNTHDTPLAIGAMKQFIKYVIDGISFQYNDAAIMKYLDDDHPLRLKILEDTEFIDYLVEIGKAEYLPAELKDLFVF